MFLVGSLAAGFANVRSDVDVLVVSAHGGAAPEADNGALVLEEATTTLAVEALGRGQKLQVEIIDRDRLSLIQRTAARFLDDEREIAAGRRARPTVGVLPFENLRLLQRLHAGLELFSAGHDGVWAGLTRRDLADYIALVHNLDLLNALEDLIGLLESSGADDEPALIPTICALRHRICFQVCGALLASVGRPYIGEKFLFRLLAQSGETIGRAALADRLMRAYAEPIRAVSDLEATFQLTDEALDAAVERSESLARWYATRGRSPIRADGTWRRGRVGVAGVK